MIIPMDIEWDPAKRQWTIDHRGLDFARAGEVFAGRHVTRQDYRRDYGEPRFFTMGLLDNTVVALAWTPRGAARRIVSMRHAHARELQRFQGTTGPDPD